MRNKWLNTSVLAVSFFLFGTGARGQFFPFGSLGGEHEETAISLVSGDPCKIVAHFREVLSDHQNKIDSASYEIARMKQQKRGYTRRLAQVAELLSELKKKEADDLEPLGEQKRDETATNTHVADFGDEATLPGRVTSLDDLARVLGLAVDRIEQVEDLLLEERQSLSVGLEKCDAIIAQCDQKLRIGQKGDRQKRESTSLFRALSVSHDLYLAELDLSFARSRQRSYDVGDVALNSPISANKEHLNAGPAETRKQIDERGIAGLVEAREIREETSDVAESVREFEEKHRVWMRMATKTRNILTRIEVYIATTRVDELKQELKDAISRVVVSNENLKEQRAIARAAQEKIDTQIRTLKKERSTLLDESLGGYFVDSVEISATYAQDIARIELKEKILLLELEKAQARFVEGAYETLYLIQEEQSPSPDILEAHRQILDESRLEERIKETSLGCEAWRRQRTTIAERQVTPEQTEIKEKILFLLDLVIDHCAKQEEVLKSGGRLAFIVRAHLSSYTSESRSFWWYFKCIALSLLFLVVALVLSALVNRGMLSLSQKTIKLIQQRLERVTVVKTESLNRYLREFLRHTFFIVYVLAIIALWIGTIVLTLKLVWNQEWKIDLPTMMGASLFLIGKSSITLAHIFKLVAILVLTVVGTRLIQAFLRYQVFHFFDWDSGVKHAVAVVVRYIILLIGFTVGLEYLGVGLEMFAVVIGVIGIGVGFGLQKLAANYVSGFVILFSRPVKKGDFITVADDLEGQIIEVGMRTTTVRTRDNISVILPNSEIVAEKVINWSYGDSLIRLRVKIGVAYGSDVDDVERVLLDVADMHRDVLYTPAPRVWFIAFGESSLDFELLVWVSNITKRFVIVSDLNKAIDRGFRDKGITIPFPQRDIHIKRTVKERPKNPVEKTE